MKTKEQLKSSKNARRLMTALRRCSDREVVGIAMWSLARVCKAQNISDHEALKIFANSLRDWRNKEREMEKKSPSTEPLKKDTDSSQPVDIKGEIGVDNNEGQKQQDKHVGNAADKGVPGCSAVPEGDGCPPGVHDR